MHILLVRGDEDTNFDSVLWWTRITSSLDGRRTLHTFLEAWRRSTGPELVWRASHRVNCVVHKLDVVHLHHTHPITA